MWTQTSHSTWPQNRTWILVDFLFSFPWFVQFSSHQCPQTFDLESTPWHCRCSLVTLAPLDAFDWQLFSGLLPTSLFLLTRTLTCYGTGVFSICRTAHQAPVQYSCTPQEKQFCFLAPSQICHPASLHDALLSVQQAPSEFGGNRIQRVFLSQCLWAAAPLLSSLLLYMQVCVFASVCTGGLATVGAITCCVLAHTLLFVNSAAFSICQLDDVCIAFKEQWGHPVVTWVKINYSRSCQQDQISKRSCFFSVWLVFHHSSLCCKVPDRRLGWLLSLLSFPLLTLPPTPHVVSYLSATEIRKLGLS